MPKAFPPEFRDEVVRVARRREQSLRQTAKDFGISESHITALQPSRTLAPHCLNLWFSLYFTQGHLPTRAHRCPHADLPPARLLGCTGAVGMNCVLADKDCVVAVPKLVATDSAR